jgi:inosine-uridine nucleoside N-ribohydrolase
MTVAVALDEKLITSAIEAFVRVDVGHHHGRGLTTLVRRHPKPNARVVTAVNEKGLFEMLEAAWR